MSHGSMTLVTPPMHDPRFRLITASGYIHVAGDCLDALWCADLLPYL